MLNKSNITQQTRTKRVQDQVWLGRKGDLQGIEQEIKICPYNQRVYAQTRISPREWNAKNSLGFLDTNGSPNRGHKTRPNIYLQEKKNLISDEFCFPTDHRGKMTESEKISKYSILYRELKMLQNKRRWVIHMVVDAFELFLKGLKMELEELEISGRIVTI